jgi:hypothetical protein
MDQEIKKRWVEALRSGKYRQGRERLRSTDNDFCCLGVLCDVIDPDGWLTEEESDGVAIPHRHWNNDSLPPRVITDKAGLKQGEVETLWHMNDGVYFSPSLTGEATLRMRTFGEIADHIEKNL